MAMLVSEGRNDMNGLFPHCYHCRLYGYPESGLTSKATVVLRGHAATRAIQIRMTYTVTQSHGDTSGPKLWPRTMSKSLVLLQSMFVLMFMALITIESHATAQGLGYHLGPCWCQGPHYFWAHADLRALQGHPGLL